MKGFRNMIAQLPTFNSEVGVTRRHPRNTQKPCKISFAKKRIKLVD